PVLSCLCSGFGFPKPRVIVLRMISAGGSREAEGAPAPPLLAAILLHPVPRSRPTTPSIPNSAPSGGLATSTHPQDTSV
ncbi:hypothetical protein HPB47_025739, partial [Ixodes persulcatus]